MIFLIGPRHSSGAHRSRAPLEWRGPMRCFFAVPGIGGLVDSKPPMPMPSASYRSTREWTPVDSRARPATTISTDVNPALGLGQRLRLLAQVDRLDALAAPHDLRGRSVDLAQVAFGLCEVLLEVVDALLQALGVAHH